MRGSQWVALVAGVLAFASCGGSDTKPTDVGVQIAAPADGSAVTADRVTVRGTVSPPDATVQILGRPAQVGNGVFTGSVALHTGSNTIDVVASAAGAAPATATIVVKRLVRKPAARGRSRAVARRAPPFSHVTACGDGITAGTRTSCAFAENVRATFDRLGPGMLDVYSPTTGVTYRMYCTSGAAVVCTGGNGASVYFSIGTAAVGYDAVSCGGGLLVGPKTSCGFARNVRAEFKAAGAGWLRVYSPFTGRTYDMYCTETSPHACTGGNDAAVYFP